MSGAIAVASLGVGGASVVLEAPAIVQAATCTYVINADGVNIRFGPGTNYGVYTVKKEGDIVTGPCAVTSTGWVKLYKNGGGYVYVYGIYVNRV